MRRDTIVVADRPGRGGDAVTDAVVLPSLRTEHLVLAPVQATEARAVLAGEPSVPVGPGWPLADTVETLRAALEYGGDLGWFVLLDGAVIGDCGVHGGVDSDGDLEIRYGIAVPHRRRGYATEVVGALVQWAWGQPEVRRVVARRVLADNVASRRALERCGFTLTDADARYVAYAQAHGK